MPFLILKETPNMITHANSHCLKLNVVILKSVQYLKIGQNGQVVLIHVEVDSERKLETALRFLTMEEDPGAYSMTIHAGDLLR